jgi:hypothetical protein
LLDAGKSAPIGKLRGLLGIELGCVGDYIGQVRVFEKGTASVDSCSVDMMANANKISLRKSHVKVD